MRGGGGNVDGDNKMLDWSALALESEIAYSQALKSKPVQYDNFIHLQNECVSWNGDFNRAVGIRCTDFQSFENVVAQVELIHREKELEKPNRYDMYAPALDAQQWRDYLLKRGYSLQSAIFFFAPTLCDGLPSEFSFRTPTETEYVKWFCDRAKSRDYYDKEWFQTLLPLQLNFIQVFKPYWLTKNTEMVGWVYCANLGEYLRLFEVEIRDEFQNQGFGRLLMRAARMEANKQETKFVLLQAGERLRDFYEKNGFEECTSNSIIRLK